MSGVAGFFIELGLRLVVFTGVFWAAAVKDFITIDKKWARPLIAGVFALLDTGLYRLLAPLLDLAVGAFAMPLIMNVVLLLVTVRVFKTKKWVETDGLFSTTSVALALTVAHGALQLLFTAI